MEGITTLDQANMTKILNLITFPSNLLFIGQKELDKSLNNLDVFFIKYTPPTDPVPIQFSKASEIDFKAYTRGIARNLGSFRKIALYELQEMTRMKSKTTEPFRMGEEPEVKFSPEMEKEGFISKITKPFQREEPSFNLVRNSISELTKFHGKYQNWLHWYWLACRKREKINSRDALQKILENMIIYFNTFLEPNLLMAQSYAHDIARDLSAEKAVVAVTAYLMGKQRANQPPPQLPYQQI